MSREKGYSSVSSIEARLDLEEAIRRSIPKMSFEEHVCLWLIYYCGQSYAFVSELLNETRQTITRFHRSALSKIRSELEPLE